ncbi:LacI family DNA-binding transcriptional regulator [Cellulosimicrobium terreum]|nr:LacI family DNA-binding transcriptional regulator [Cellulosimicrobium terreum]
MTTHSSPGASSPQARPDPAGRRITITDVARAAGVSIAVVSYALNDRPGVSERTRRHVLRTADDLGWRPSAAARALRAHARSVCLQVVHTVRDDAAAVRVLDLAAGMRPRLAEHDVALDVAVVSDRGHGARDIEAGWHERRHAAFVVSGMHDRDPRRTVARDNDIPLVEVSARRTGRLGATPDADTGAHAGAGTGTGGGPGVTTGDQTLWFTGDADARAARYLVELGHRHVALLVGDAHDDVARALHAAMGEAGGPDTRVTLVECRTWDETRTSAARLLAGDDRPTAVLTEGGTSALAVLESARRRGLEVPWDLSVLSGEDSPTCRLVAPALTAVHRPFERLGAAVADAVVRRLGWARASVLEKGDDAPEVPPTPVAKLVLRGTTAPPRTA